jgi:hypothetical protein
MMILAIGVEHALDVTFQCPHDANACKHRRSAKLHHEQKAFHCRSPFRRFVLSLWKLGDVIAGILQRDELASAGKRDWIFEWTFPAAISHLRPVATRPNIGGAFDLASPQTELSAPLKCAPRKDQNTGSDEARNEVAEPAAERDTKES